MKTENAYEDIKSKSWSSRNSSDGGLPCQCIWTKQNPYDFSWFYAHAF